MDTKTIIAILTASAKLIGTVVDIIKDNTKK